MKISLALAAYNGEKYIVSQLDSLLAQTRQPDEVVIIDDRSTDRTPEIIADYIKSHGLAWNFSVAECNSGYQKNFYNCLKKCTGDVVFLCDQDDEWHSDKIETLEKLLEQDERRLAVNSSFEIIDGSGRRMENFRRDSDDTSNNGLILYKIPDGAFVQVELFKVLMYNISPGCTCAFRKSVVDEYLETSNCIMPHDWELNIIAAKHDGLYFLNKPLIGYRIHGGNAIGLSSGHPEWLLKIEGTEEIRFKMFEIQKEQADMFSLYLDHFTGETERFVKSYIRFCDNREKILYGYKFMPCLKNFLLYGRVRASSNIFFKGLLGDVLYVLKYKFRGRNGNDKQRS